jgi:very-short-patch-repair endonuclease
MARRKITEARKRGYAQAMRDNPTDAERALASALWRKRLRPRRQVIVHGYIVDFLFVRQRVVVEVDGYYHFTAKGRTADKIRTGVLTRNGYTVIRYSNSQVLRDPDKCAIHIASRVAHIA